LSEVKQHVRMLADLVNMCINQVELMVKFGDTAKTMIEELQRKADQEGADD
jgi:transcriptional regulator